jgi:hypothetical protein
MDGLTDGQIDNEIKKQYTKNLYRNNINKETCVHEWIDKHENSKLHWWKYKAMIINIWDEN